MRPDVAVVLACLDEPTQAFYRRWDFREVPDHPLRMFLSAAELAAMMRGSSGVLTPKST